MLLNQAATVREVLDLVEVLRAAGARLGTLAGEGALELLPDAGLPEVVLALLGATEPMNATTTTLIARVHASGAMPDGHVSVARWLQNEARLSSGDATAALGRGRALADDYVATRLAWFAGTATQAQARAITLGVERAVRSLPTESKDAFRRQGEALLLSLTDIKTPDELAAVAKRLRFTLDPDGTDQDSLDAFDEQKVTFTPVGDGVEVRGFLTAEAAAGVRLALEQVVSGWFRDGRLAAEDALPAGSARGDSDDPRTRRARRLRTPHLHALALAELCGVALETGAVGTKHGQTPRITLTAELASLSTMGGSLHVPGVETPTPVPPTGMLRLLCDSYVATIIDGGASGDPAEALRSASREVLWVGREERTVSPRLRRALEHRDQHCAFPGCRVVVGRCHAHHVVHWSTGGGTDLDNLVLLCSRHHHRVHEGGWTIRAAGSDARRSGYWSFAPPRRRPRP